MFKTCFLYSVLRAGDMRRRLASQPTRAERAQLIVAQQRRLGHVFRLDERHVCTNRCTFFSAPGDTEVSVCAHTGAPHFCGPGVCDCTIEDRDGIVCRLSGRFLGVQMLESYEQLTHTEASSALIARLQSRHTAPGGDCVPVSQESTAADEEGQRYSVGLGVAMRLLWSAHRAAHAAASRKHMILRIFRDVRRVAASSLAAGNDLRVWELIAAVGDAASSSEPGRLRRIPDCSETQDRLARLAVRCIAACVRCRHANKERRAGNWPTEEYIALGAFYLMREGILHEAMPLLPSDALLRDHLPHMSSLDLYGYKKNKLTVALRFIKESIGIGVRLLPLHQVLVA